MAQREDKADKIVSQIISSLKNQERAILLPKIIKGLQKFDQMYSSTGEIVSAIPLEKQYIEKIESVLEKKLNEKIQLHNKIDKSIIGGFIVTFRDMVLDQSMKRKLNEIEQKAYETR